MGSGNCIFWAPETFDLSDDGHAVVADAAATDEERLRIAAQGCPVGAISLWRDGAEVPLEESDVMPIAVTEEHESLRATAQRWLETHCPPTVPREVAEAPRRVGRSCRRCGRRWRRRVGSACTCPRSTGGQGFTLAELAVVARGARARALPRTAAADAAGLGRPGPARRAAGRRAAGLAARAWPTARSRPPWRSARRRSHWQPARRTGRSSLRGRPCARCSGLPAARLVLVPARRRHRRRTWLPARPGGARRRGRASRRCRPSTPPVPSGSSTVAGDGVHGAAGRAGHGARRRRARPGPRARPRPRARASPAGAWRRRRTTPRCASSSAVPSASSRR